MSNICAGCSKRVYAAEWVGPISDGKYYHKGCLTCKHCNKGLQLGQFSEHAGVPYCKTDYNRLFSIKGFGHGGATDSFDAQAAVPTPAEKEPVVELTFGTQVVDAPHPVLFTTGCPKCGKKVYFNERTVFDNNEWHQKCFQCTKCKKSLSGGQFSEHNKFPYCKRCHESQFGAKGFGFGGAAVLH